MTLPSETDWLEAARLSFYKTTNLAALLGLSVRQLERLFRTDCAARPCSWLLEVRLWSASRFLLEGQMPKEFFSDLGYQSASAFIYAFRAYHGCTTGEYRRAVLGSGIAKTKRLEDYFPISNLNVDRRDSPEHVLALKLLGSVPNRSDRLKFYFLRYRFRNDRPRPSTAASSGQVQPAVVAV